MQGGPILAQIMDRASRPGVRRWVAVLIVGVTLVAGTAIVYATGGTGYAYPYVMFVPVLVAAAVFALPGALVTALIAGLALGPYMPMDVAGGVDQTTVNWLTRLAFFLGIGGVAGALFGRLQGEAAARDRAARHDARSGLPNQVALEDALAGAIERTADGGGRVSLLLVRAIDLQEVLEAVGADAGDDVVRALAGRLQEGAGVGDAIFRYSASELAIMVTGSEDHGLGRLAGELQTAAESGLVVRDVPIRLELAIGIASTMRAAEGPYELIRRARIALFAAREREQDHCFYSWRFERRTAETIRLITRLADALEAEEFELHYQPKMRLDDRTVFGVEALIRWRDPARGIVPPMQFMPKVEQTRLIQPLTRFVVRETARFLGAHDGLYVSFNLSMRNLYDAVLIGELVELVGAGGIDPARLEVEITETALMRQPEAAVQALERLHRAGIAVSIDDFGTGHASFEYLRRFPVTGMKIDRVFLEDADSDTRTRSLLRSMIAVGHSLGLEVTAEGVEREAVFDTLVVLRCNCFQGYWLSPPLPEGELIEWIRARG